MEQSPRNLNSSVRIFDDSRLIVKRAEWLAFKITQNESIKTQHHYKHKVIFNRILPLHIWFNSGFAVARNFQIYGR